MIPEPLKIEANSDEGTTPKGAVLYLKAADGGIIARLPPELGEMAQRFAHTDRIIAAAHQLLDDTADSEDDYNPDTEELYQAHLQVYKVLQEAGIDVKPGRSSSLGHVERDIGEAIAELGLGRVGGCHELLERAMFHIHNLPKDKLVDPAEGCRCNDCATAMDGSSTLIDTEELQKNLRMIEGVATRLYLEKTLTGDEMRDLAQKLKEGVVSNLKHYLPKEKP